MKHLLVMFIAILLITQIRSETNGQSKIIGRIYDSSISVFLSGASVICIKEKDSTKMRVNSTDREGHFLIDSLLPGSYLLTVSYLGYKSSSHLVRTNYTQKIIDLGIISIQRIGLDLTAVEVRETKNQVKIRRDTVEYNANNFAIRPNATVEDLLKKLPGIEVGDDGSITINGEIAKQILIDGRIFFLDDPKLISRYLLSEMVDKVQLINRKKDLSQSNGISGQRTEKVINITIKQDRRNEITGQLSSSYGIGNKFASKVNLTRFREKQQLGLFVTGDNVNGFQDGSTNANDGVVKSWKGGINYSEDLSKKIAISSSYLIDNKNGLYQKKSTQQNLLLDSNYYVQQSQSIDRSTNQVVNLKLDYKIDSLQTLSFTNVFGYQNSTGNQIDSFRMVDKQTKIQNNGWIGNSSIGSGYNMRSNIIFNRNFKKEGRLLNINFSYSINKQRATNYNMSMSEYSQDARDTRRDTINQKRSSVNKNEFAQLFLTYIEPVFKKHSLTFTYLLTRNRASSDLPVYDYNTHNRAYSHLNDTTSNSYLNESIYHYFGLGISTSRKMYDYNISLNALVADMHNNNITKDNNTELRNSSVLPNTYFNYYFNPGRQLSISYLINVEMPDVAQLQPFVDNSSPLYIQRGNSYLKPSHIHSASVGYNVLNTKSLRNISVSLRGDYITKRIINGTFIDSLGRQISQPMNKDGAYTISVGVDNSYPIKKVSTLKLSAILGLNRDVNFLNGKDGFSRNISVTQSIAFRSSYRSVFDILASGSFSYNNLKYNNANNNSNFFSYKFSLDWNANIPLGIVIGGNVKYLLNTGMVAGYNANAFVINAYIFKYLLKTKQLVIKIHGFDLLNRNTNNIRTVNDSYITDTYSIGLQRLFLFNLTYYIKRNKASGK